MNEIIIFLDDIYREDKRRLDMELNHLINDYYGSSYTTGIPFDNLSYQETMEYYLIHGDDFVYNRTTPYYTKYLQWDTWMWYYYRNRI